MKVLIVRTTASFRPSCWRDLPSEFRIVSEMNQDDPEGFCLGFNSAELLHPVGFWALTCVDRAPAPAKNQEPS